MDTHQQCRRRFLGRAALTLPALATLTLWARSEASAAGTASKADFHYQDHPNGSDHCANCVAFIPPPSGQAYGNCSIVAGPVSPNGWCMAFSAK